MNRSWGFTLIEVLLSIVILGLSAVAISEAYLSGLRAMEIRVADGQLDSALRSQMEFLLAQRFDDLTSGSASVTVEGEIHTVTWTVGPVDLDGDMVPDAGAKLLTVTLDAKSLDTIVADDAGCIGKI